MTFILTGIITDTGGFQYQSTTPETFEFASELLKKGVNVSDIYKRVMNTKSRANFELRKRAIDRMEFLEDDKISFTYITLSDIEEAEAVSMIITEMIKQRKALGWSQRELAQRCEMPQSSIARIEAQTTTPNISTLLRIFNKLGLRLSVTYK